jgi:iron complex transport system substrate-binding protein
MTVMGPERIVCLTTETCEVLYRLGREDRIVGISGFTVHPPRARREKPKVAAYTSAKIDQILALEPDLVLGFSDLQAELAAELIRAGVAVHVFNQRDVAGILDMVFQLGALVDAGDAAGRLVGELAAGIERVRRQAEQLPRRPRVYFEEWDEPMICGIGWVSELIGIAGGEDILADRAMAPDAARRILEGPEVVIERAPELVVGSWCGKRFRPERVLARPGFDRVPAVRAGRLHEIKSADILQPGPAALTRGLEQLHALVREAAGPDSGILAQDDVVPGRL